MMAAMGMNAMGQAAANTTNAKENAKARDFGREQAKFNVHMQNTAYQRSVKDMKKAGINPMMAFSQGGAQSPSSTPASPGGGFHKSAIGEGVSSAVNIAQLKRQKALSESQEDLFKQKGMESYANTTNVQETGKQIRASTKAVQAESQERVKRARMNSATMHTEKALGMSRTALDGVTSALPLGRAAKGLRKGSKTFRSSPKTGYGRKGYGWKP